MKQLLHILAISACLASCNVVSEFELPGLISDGMVLQQNAQVKLWGRALPGTQVRLSTDWDISTSAITLPDSTWEITLSTLGASNTRHSVTISAPDTSVTIRDILFGEVWIAAGQSNLEMPLKGWNNDSVEGAQAALRAANDSLLRFYNVQRKISVTEEPTSGERWQICTPNNATNFSAAAFFCACMLRDSLNIPVGVISANYGGARCEAWISSDALRNDEDFGAVIANTEHIINETRQHQEWLSTLNSINIMPTKENTDPLKSINVGDEYVTSNDVRYEEWDSIQVPCIWEHTPEVGEFDGIIWFANTVRIPQSWTGKNIKIHLGAIDDRDRVYVNGVMVGEHSHDGYYNVERVYTIPPAITRSRTLRIAVRITDSGGLGGFMDNDDCLYLECGKRQKNISGIWHYRIAGEFYNDKLALFDLRNTPFDTRSLPENRINCNTPSVIYNGMIAPIRRYTVAGVMWYQGESNVGKSFQYERLCRILFSNWRKAFGSPNMPFYVVQLAPWKYSGENNRECAYIREAQRRAVAYTPNTYLISTLDLGSPENIHLTKKRDVGERTALRILRNTYNRKLTDAGPELANVSTAGPLLILSFSNSEGLYIDSSKPNQFEVAGDDGQYFYATALAQDEQITLFSHAVPAPISVRYAFRNCSQATLFNGAGLPAPSFSSSKSKPVEKH